MRSALPAVAVSMALHAGAVAVLGVALPKEERLPALLLDLTRMEAARSGAAVASVPGRLAGSTSARLGPGSSPARHPIITSAGPEPPSASIRSLPPTPGESREAAPAAPAAGETPAREPDPTPLAASAPPPPAIAPQHPPARSPTERRLAAGGDGGAWLASEGTSGRSSGRGVDGAGQGLDGGARRGVAGGSGGTSQVGDGSAGGRAGSGGTRAETLALRVPGGGEADGGVAYGAYLARLRERIQQALRYPPAARRRGLAGTVDVEIVVLPTGAVGDVTLLDSSSHRILDEAAMETVRGLGVVPFPADLPPRTLRIRLPVVFELR